MRVSVKKGKADLTRRLPVCPLFAKRIVPRQPHLSPTLAELHHETLDSGSPHGRRFGFPISCVRGRQDYRSGPRRLRRWFRMEAGGGHSPESWLLRIVVQEPETSFAADVAATRRVLDKAGPCVLVGHSYGGMIITETGMHPDVKALVYVAAVQPDVGESLSD